MSTPANSLNISSVGIPYFTGTTFQAVTDGAANSTVLVGNGVGVVPSFTATPQITGLGIGAASTGTGLTFDGTSTLSIFSQGTFTPINAGSVTPGSFTYDAAFRIGRYQKVGRMVTVKWLTTWTAIGGATGQNLCTNLPYTALNQSANNAFMSWTTEIRPLPFGAGGLYSNGFVISNTTYFGMYAWDSATGVNGNLPVTTTGSCSANFMYETA